jgi:hypothetical protein
VTEKHGSASIGPYTQPDPIGFAGGLNLYGYAGGDPVNKSDPFGLCEWWIVFLGGGCPEIEGIDVTVNGGGGESGTIENVGWGGRGEPSLLGGWVVDLCAVDRDACEMPHVGSDRLGRLGEPSQAGMFSPCGMAIGLAVVNTAAAGFGVYWMSHALRARNYSRNVAGAAPAIYNAAFRENVAIALAPGLVGGTWSAVTGAPGLWKTPDVLGGLKFLGGFFAPSAMFISGLDALRACDVI